MIKNNKKGFTLVELLVTIGIIGIILTISTISVYTIINNSRNNSNKITINNIKKVTKIYAKEYENEISWKEKNTNEFETCISLQTLIAKGYLKKDILNKENIPLSIILTSDEYYNIISEKEQNIDCNAYSKIVQIPTSNDICNNYTYDGNNHFLIKPNIKTTDYMEIKYNDTTYKNTNNVLEHPKNAGEYKVSINLAPGKQWSDNTTKAKTVTCKINKKTPDVELSSTGNSDTLENIGTREITLKSEVSGNITIKSSNKNYVTAQVVGTKNITANEKKTIKITTHAQRNSPTSITITVVPTGDYTNNYKNGTVTYTVGNIKTKTIDKPICYDLTYNATEQKLAKTNEAYQLINNTAIEIGNYTITARLKYGYIWKDNTTDNIEINCQIKTPEPEVTYKDATCTPESIDVIYGKRYGEKQQLCIPTKIGYTFSGWYSDNNFTKKITNDTIVTNFNNHNLYAKWTANTNTKYVVQHYKMNLDGVNYTLADTDNLTGTTDSKITPATKNYTGFTAPPTETITISADGSSIVKYYYTRNSYTVTLKKENGISEVTGNGTYKYGESITITATPANGFIFDSWTGTHTSSLESYTFTMSTSDVTMTATAKTLFTSQEFEYIGEVEEFPVPATGTYQLEVWGAAGGDSLPLYGGKGGYSKGTIKLNEGDILYVCVGQKGIDYNGSYSRKSYNGGGAGGEQSGGGGGATHIATADGVLSELSSNKSAVLIVAGGGGGADYEDWNLGRNGYGGDGGGTTGSNGGSADNRYGTGGNQSSAGYRYDKPNDSTTKGGFGYGGGDATTLYGGGGGSGWYGGGAGGWNNGTSGGGGGSGYTGGVSNGEMQTGINNNNGYAIITLIDY